MLLHKLIGSRHDVIAGSVEILVELPRFFLDRHSWTNSSYSAFSSQRFFSWKRQVWWYRFPRSPGSLTGAWPQRSSRSEYVYTPHRTNRLRPRYPTWLSAASLIAPISGCFGHSRSYCGGGRYRKLSMTELWAQFNHHTWPGPPIVPCSSFPSVSHDLLDTGFTGILQARLIPIEDYRTYQRLVHGTSMGEGLPDRFRQ